MQKKTLFSILRSKDLLIIKEVDLKKILLVCVQVAHMLRRVDHLVARLEGYATSGQPCDVTKPLSCLT